MKRIDYILGALAAACGLSLASCQVEPLTGPDRSSGHPVTVFLGTVPTRAGEDVPDIADERRIMTADVFAYERSSGHLVNSVHKTFGVGLETGASVEMEISNTPVDIYSVVNFPGDIQEAGKTLSGLREAVSSYTDNALGFFTMTGKSLNFNPAVSTSASIVLKRIADKVVVKRITSDFSESSPLHGKKVTLKDIRLVNVRRQVTLFPDNDIDPRPVASDASFINPRSFTDMYMSLYGRPHFGEVSDGGYSLDESLYFYPNSSAEASSVAGDDYVTKIVFTFDIGGTVYRYPVGLPQVVGSAGRNLVYEISNLRLYMSGNPESDSPNKYISGTTLSMTLNVLDWDTYEDWRGMTHDPVMSKDIKASDNGFSGMSGSTTISVVSSNVTMTGMRKPAGWTAMYSSDGGENWTGEFPSWLVLSAVSGSGSSSSAGESVSVSYDISSVDLSAVAPVIGFFQNEGGALASVEIPRGNFMGTASGNFTARVYNGSSEVTAKRATVTVSDGKFCVFLPALSSGERYFFQGVTALTSITRIPALRSGTGTLENTFKGCSNLVSICDLETTGATSMSAMFRDCVSLVSAPAMNTSSCKFLDFLFYNCSSLVSIPDYDYSAIKNSEASTVSKLSSAFLLCPNLVDIAGMSGLEKDANFRGDINLSVQSLLNIANTVAANPMSWSGINPTVPPTTGSNDSGTNVLNIRVSGTPGTTTAGDGSVRVRMYNDDPDKYAEAIRIFASKGWAVNN